MIPPPLISHIKEGLPLALPDEQQALLMLNLFGVLHEAPLTSNYPLLKKHFNFFRQIEEHLLHPTKPSWVEIGRWNRSYMAKTNLRISACFNLLFYLQKVPFPAAQAHFLGCSVIPEVNTRLKEREEQITKMALQLFQVGTREQKVPIEKWLEEEPMCHANGALIHEGKVINWLDALRQFGDTELAANMDHLSPLLTRQGAAKCTEVVLQRETMVLSFQRGLVEQSVVNFLQHLDLKREDLAERIVAEIREFFTEDETERRALLYLSYKKRGSPSSHLGNVAQQYFDRREEADDYPLLFTELYCSAGLNFPSPTYGFIQALESFIGSRLAPQTIWQFYHTDRFNAELFTLLQTLTERRKQLLEPTMRTAFSIPLAWDVEIRLTCVTLEERFASQGVKRQLMQLLHHLCLHSILPIYPEHWSDPFPQTFYKGKMRFANAQTGKDLGRLQPFFPYARQIRGLYRQWSDNLILTLSVIKDAYVPETATLEVPLTLSRELLEAHPTLCQNLRSIVHLVASKPELNLPSDIEANGDEYSTFLAYLALYEGEKYWGYEIENKEEIGVHFFRFLHKLKAGYRTLIAEIPARQSFAIEQTESELAARKNIYKVAGGLSILPQNHPKTQEPPFFLSEAEYLDELRLAERAILAKKPFSCRLGEDTSLSLTFSQSYLYIEMQWEGVSFAIRQREGDYFGPPFVPLLRWQILMLRSRGFCKTPTRVDF